MLFLFVDWFVCSFIVVVFGKKLNFKSNSLVLDVCKIVNVVDITKEAEAMALKINAKKNLLKKNKAFEEI